MSLRIAGSIAQSALRSSEVGMAVASSNVANADTAGYTRKTANVTTYDTAVGSTAVQTASISSAVNNALLKTIIGAQSDLGYADVRNSYLDQLQSSLGTTDSDGTLAAAIDDLSDVTSTLATSPESESAKSAVVSNLETVASELRTASSTVQDLRDQADEDIATTVDRINATLTTIDDLNDRIAKAKGLGQDTTDLKDQRAEALKSLSEDIPITYQTDSNGKVRVSTSSGQALVDSSVHTLSYTPAASVSASTSYESGGFQGIMLDGKDITGSVKSGTLGGLIQLRDTDLPAQQAALDELATTLMDQLNGIANNGTAAPPPNALTGTTTVSGSDAFSGSGTLRIAVTDSDGTAVEVLDLDLSAYSTVDEVVAAIDGMSNLSASVSADGTLTIQADNSDYGVALGGDDDSVGTDGDTFSAAFGLNDLLTGTGASDIKVSSTLAADSSRLPTAALSTTAGLAAGDSAVASGDGTTAQALKAAFTDTVSFDAAGSLSARSTTLSGYAGAVVQAAATAADKAASAYDDQELYTESLASSFASQSGVNVDEETAAISQLQTAYEAAAAVFKVVREMFDTALDMVQ